MKIVCLQGFTVKPDTALLRNGEPFYVPDWATEVTFRHGRAVKITRLVKCIEERFAHRCYDEAAEAVDFTAEGVEFGRVFDRSLAISPEFTPHIGDPETDRAIALVSRFVTLKIGDLVFIPTGKEEALTPETKFNFDIR